MKNIFKIFIIITAALFLGFSNAQAVNTKTNCQNGVCGVLGDNLPEGATKITPSTSVNLTFTVHRQADPNEPPICNEGTQLFYAVRHGIGGSATNWDYVKAGSGQEAEYTFNSGPDQQKNRYQGVFYCWSFQGTSKAKVDAVVNQLKVFNQVWFTPEFNMASGTVLPVTGGTKKPDTGGKDKSTSLEFSNPLAAEDLEDLLGIIQNWLFYLALPIAVIVIVVSGILMMAARGDPTRFAKGKKMLLWVVVGLAVILIGEGFLYLIESIINLKNR